MSASLNCKQINKDIFCSTVNHLDLADKFMHKWNMHHSIVIIILSKYFIIALNRRNARIHKTYCLINDGCYLPMRSSSICTKKTSVYILTVLRKRPKFWRESLRGVKLVKNFNIIQFGFSMMWRIVRISEAVTTFSLICIILHIILSLIQ